MKHKLILFLVLALGTAIFADDHSIPKEVEPAADSESVAELESASDPEPAADPESVVELEPAPDHEPAADPEPVAELEPALDPEPAADPEPVAGIEPESGESAAAIAEQEPMAGGPVFTTETVRSLLLSAIFEADTTVPTPATIAALDSIAALSMLNNPLYRYEVHGHSCVDAEGRNLTMRYSIQRVEAMMNFLLTNGVSARNIVTIFHGPGRFDDIDDLAVGAECVHDRRVDIMLMETRYVEAAPEPEPVVEPEPEPAVTIVEPEPEPEPEPIVLPPSLESLALEQGKMAVAIYMAGEEPAEARGVHNILGGELARTLSEGDAYLAVDRTEAILDQLAREHTYQRSGAVDDDQIKSLGQQLGVQYLCISNINPVGKRFYLDTRLVDVVTAEIVRSITATSRLNNANEMTRVARNIAHELLEAERTREQRERRKKIFRYTAIGLDMLGAGALAFGYLENNSIKDLVDDGEYPEAKRVVPRRNAAYIVGGALLATGVSFHILF